MQVLQLDQKGFPQRWVCPQDAALYYATDAVAWTVGDVFASLRGGISARSGLQSSIDLHPIIAVRGESKVSLFDSVPSLTNRKLFARDRYTCVYCGKLGKPGDLTREHIIPVSRGGQDTFLNTACACKGCNGRKGSKTLEESGMALLYLPYMPSAYENLILAGRHIRADVHEWLAAKLPKGSRLA